MIVKKLLFFLAFSLCSFLVYGQKNISIKDSLDHKLDLSDWVIHANGFIPIPLLITEPAMGGFGGALMGVFVDPNEPYLDSIDGKLVRTRVKPNIYGGGGGYTANGSWFAGGVATGVIRKWRTNYRVATGYFDMNLNFYRTFPEVGEKTFEFNIETMPISVQLIKQIRHSPWYAGLDYVFMKAKLSQTNVEFHSPKEVNSVTSRLGLLVDYDSRDNVFTPDKGFRWNTLIGNSNEYIGSDYEFTQINSAAFAYLPIFSNIVSGFRLEYQQMFGDAPFYMKPYINLRGIPVMRYQGEIVTLAETEWRWDFTPRYSLLVFGGTGKAIPDGSSFKDASWRGAGGGGLRYLVARKLKLRMGVDVARGPEEWAYYIVFGTNWVR